MADVSQTGDPTPAQVHTSLLAITPLAAEKVRALMAERDLSDLALRVFVQGGGCSGLIYGMAFEETVYPQDVVIEAEGVRLVIDPNSLAYMRGSEIDFVDGPEGSGFAINNPNSAPACGCGHAAQTNTGGGCSGCG